MSERVRCPECGTTTVVATVEEALDTADTHDENQHDGERTALVNGMLPPSDELAEAASEAVEQLREIKRDLGSES